MAAKKKLKLNEAPLEPTAEVPLTLPASTPFVAGTCIQCHWLETGTWFGPRCINPASPAYRTHRPDAGTCDEFSPKIRQPIPQPLPETEEGLYNPEPVKSDLQELLDRETEQPQRPEDV